MTVCISYWQVTKCHFFLHNFYELCILSFCFSLLIIRYYISSGSNLSSFSPEKELKSLWVCISDTGTDLSIELPVLILKESLVSSGKIIFLDSMCLSCVSMRKNISCMLAFCVQWCKSTLTSYCKVSYYVNLWCVSWASLLEMANTKITPVECWFAEWSDC